MFVKRALSLRLINSVLYRVINTLASRVTTAVDLFVESYTRSFAFFLHFTFCFPSRFTRSNTNTRTYISYFRCEGEKANKKWEGGERKVFVSHYKAGKLLCVTRFIYTYTNQLTLYNKMYESFFNCNSPYTRTKLTIYVLLFQLLLIIFNIMKLHVKCIFEECIRNA